MTGEGTPTPRGEVIYKGTSIEACLGPQVGLIKGFLSHQVYLYSSAVVMHLTKRPLVQGRLVYGQPYEPLFQERISL